MAEMTDPHGEKMRISKAAARLNECPVINVDAWSEYGQEHFRTECGEYWKPAHIRVSANMDDMAVMRVLSDVMDEYGLKVHKHHGITERGDDWARLVADHSGGDA